MSAKLEPSRGALEKNAGAFRALADRLERAVAPRLPSALLQPHGPPPVPHVPAAPVGAVTRGLQDAGHAMPAHHVGKILEHNGQPYRVPLAHGAAAEAPKPTVERVVDTAQHAIKDVPSWLLGGAMGGASGMLVDKDDRLRGAATGAGIGALGGYMWDRLPGGVGHIVTAALKEAFLSPSLSSGGTVGLSYSGGSDRLPGTSTYAGKDVIQRVGRAFDQGASYEDAVAAGADSPKVRYLPMAAAVLGGLVGRSLKNTPTGWLGGGAAGLAAGFAGRGRMQHAVDQEAQDAAKGLLLERANLGDPHARGIILQHQQTNDPPR